MLWNKHCYTISFSFVLLLVEALLEQWRLLSTSPLATGMCWQILCHKQVPTSTSLPRLTSWSDEITCHCYIWHRRRYHYSTSTITNVSLAAFILSVFHYIPSSMHEIHTFYLAPDLVPKSKQPRKITILDNNIRYNSPKQRFRAKNIFTNRLFCKTMWAFWKVMKNECSYLEMHDAPLFPTISSVTLSVGHHPNKFGFKIKLFSANTVYSVDIVRFSCTV